MFGIPNDSDYGLTSKWKQFANRAQAEASTSLVCNGGICIDHFQEKYLKRGKKRVDLDLTKAPIPTIHTSKEILSSSSLLPNVQVPRKPPTKRNYEHPLHDETNKFLKQNIIKSIDDLNDSSSSRGYHYNK